MLISLNKTDPYARRKGSKNANPTIKYRQYFSIFVLFKNWLNKIINNIVWQKNWKNKKWYIVNNSIGIINVSRAVIFAGDCNLNEVNNAAKSYNKQINEIDLNE